MSETTTVTVEPAVPAGVALLDDVVAPEGAVLNQTVDELLVEEVSIDGMCGVY